MKMEKSCGAVISRVQDGQTQILLIKHENGGHWAFPKGHVEHEETEIETAKREILEETGLIAQIDTEFRSVVTYSPKKGTMKDVVYFAATVNDAEPVAQPGEVEKICWIPLKEALRVINYENYKKVLRDYIEYITKKGAV